MKIEIGRPSSMGRTRNRNKKTSASTRGNTNWNGSNSNGKRRTAPQNSEAAAAVFGSAVYVGEENRKRQKTLGENGKNIKRRRISETMKGPSASTSISGTGRKAKSTLTASPHKSATPSTKLHDPEKVNSLDDPSRNKKTVCKERPDSREARKGSGGSKPFVPWCKKT